MYTLYVHISPNDKLYIGVTSKTMQTRCNLDGSGYSGQPLFWKAIQKYGWDNFQHIELIYGLTKEQAFECEKYLIAKYQSNNPKYGYNSSSGGEYSHVGCKLNEEQRKRLSESHKGLPLNEGQLRGLQSAHNAWKGSHHTEEAKKRIGDKNRGRKRSEETRRKIGEASKGRESYWKGKHMPEETKEKLRKANLGKKASPETIAKQRANGSQYWKGKHRSEETRRKISETLKRRFQNDERESGQTI